MIAMILLLMMILIIMIMTGGQEHPRPTPVKEHVKRLFFDFLTHALRTDGSTDRQRVKACYRVARQKRLRNTETEISRPNFKQGCIPVMAAVAVRKKVVGIDHCSPTLCLQSRQLFLFVRSIKSTENQRKKGLSQMS